MTTKKCKLTGEKIHISFPFAFKCFESKAAKKVAAILTALSEETIYKYNSNGTPVSLSEDPALSEEAYRISITEKGIHIFCNTEAAARNAAVTLYTAIQKDDDQYYLPCCTAEDWPDSRFRCMLIDMARKYLELEDVKANLRQMALAKMNKVIFHLMDSAHYALHSDCYPQLNKSNLQQYTKKQMRELVDYAAFWGIEAIPSIDLPAHACHLLTCMPELSCRVDDDFKTSYWAVCTGNEAVYSFAENIFQEVYTVFDSDLMCAFGDELEFLDLNHVEYWLNWEHCSICRAMCKREAIQGKREIFYYFIRRIHAILKKYNKRMVLGNDNVDMAYSPNIPRDILILWWRIPAPGRGPYIGCSMEKYLEEGFELINCDYPECYIDLYMTEKKLCSWTPLKRPYCPPQYIDKVLGSCLFAWEGKSHFDWTLPPGILMFGEKLWNHINRQYDSEYRRKITRILLGPDTPDGLDIFTPLGGCLLPQDEDSSRMGYPDRVDSDMIPVIDKTLDVLVAFRKDHEPQATLIDVYVRCLKWMKAQLDQKIRNIDM
mgnify:CR=1 FL=1